MGKVQVEPPRVSNPIDFDAAGRQSGLLHAPLSRNDSGRGVVEFPVVPVENGSGPTVLVTGGIQGDDYEGRSPSRAWHRTSARRACRGAVQHRVLGRRRGRHLHLLRGTARRDLATLGHRLCADTEASLKARRERRPAQSEISPSKGTR